ncbi:MAG TPA: BMC domain-containing protein [Anaerovoracaceae bacterium]|nr:BMC domain-containing protein [Anaerovoracaceae bacterium]
MKKSIGMIEYRSIAKAIESTDAMLKAANVELILSAPQCPGKFVSIVSGEVSAVENAVRAGKLAADVFVIEDYIIANVSEDIFPALSGSANYDRIESLGVIETMSAITSIMAGDIAAKSGNVKLIEIRIARGLGGKGFTILTGELASVKSAMRSCEEKLKETGAIVSAVVIASPSKSLIEAIV